MSKRKQNLITVLIIMTLLLLLLPVRPGYRAVRAFARMLPAASTNVYTSPNFTLNLTQADTELAEAILQQLEARLAELEQYLAHDTTPKPIKVRMHASQAALQKALGGNYSPTLGAYYLGRIELLSPLAWMPQLETEAALAYFATEGPVVHELTHLLLDYQAISRYPIWFTEGLAQYMEKQLQGYVWQEGGTAWRLNPHSLAELNTDFAALPQPIAYQEALSLVQFMVYETGFAGLQDLCSALGQGQSFALAVSDIWQRSLLELESDWQAWLLE